jgi:DNA-binding Lrp family transcriptional regulator
MSKQQHGRVTIFQAAAVDTYSDPQGWCFPKQATLAERLRITQQAVSKSIKQLADLGYIEIHEQKDARGMRSNSRYRLHLDHFPSQPDVVTSQPEVVIATTSEVVPVTTSEVVSATTSEVVALTSQRERPKKNDPNGKVRALPRPTLDTYQPDDLLLEGLAAERPDLHLPTVIENWRDYHRERGTAIKDFNASLRRWVRNEKAARGNARAPAPPVILPNGREVSADAARKLNLVANLKLGGM